MAIKIKYYLEIINSRKFKRNHSCIFLCYSMQCYTIIIKIPSLIIFIIQSRINIDKMIIQKKKKFIKSNVKLTNKNFYKEQHDEIRVETGQFARHDSGKWFFNEDKSKRWRQPRKWKLPSEMDRSCKGLRPPDLHGWPRIKAILVTSLSLTGTSATTFFLFTSVSLIDIVWDLSRFMAIGSPREKYWILVD